VLGIGFAAWRDVGAFFKKAAADDTVRRTPLPRPSRTRHRARRLSIGKLPARMAAPRLQPGRDGGIVHEGMWPIIAGRRIALKFRWAQPDGAMGLYQAAVKDHSGGCRIRIRSWHSAAGILDRCTATRTCPKVIEHFGSAEVWALKLTRSGWAPMRRPSAAAASRVRRYYIASTTHGGGIVDSTAACPVSACQRQAPRARATTSATGVLPAIPFRTRKQSTPCACIFATG
jgi:hypothetical protein